MLDPEPQVPSPQPVPTAGESLSSATEPEERAEEGHWWSRFLQTRGHHAATNDASPDDDHAEREIIAPAPKTVTLSEEELNARVQRQAQSLHDRETARQNRERAEAARRQLRDEDPYSYAQQEKQAEETAQVRQVQTAQLMQLLGHVGRQHDAVSVDPVLYAIPEKERERIMAMPNAGQGLPGRKLVVDEALKTYGRLEYERGYREAQSKLRKDPSFRKSVLSEFRGQYEEPELYPGSDGSTNGGLPDDNVSSILRRQYQSR